ncbi:hypothetical protein [Mycobacterium avium]|uniref:hypothetical protein n=1 Tax=Mycobacterium avium TaxID=1764 RepID=UPI001F449DFA|nr:hypothetical protein [Mycobacterium avium]
MSRVMSRRAGSPKGGDSEAETPAGSVQTLTVADETTDTEAAAEADKPDHDGRPPRAWRRIGWSRAIAYGVLPGLALLLALAAGFLKFEDASVRDDAVARAESVHAATDGTIALLSYRPETVQADLDAARGRLTGTFLQAYTSLTHDVVIPGAKQKQISAVATVPAATSTSATGDHAVVLLFVNQTVVVGQDAPASTASSVRVTLDKIGGRWLISGFDPV